MMSPRDLTVIHDWFDKFIDDHTPAILATLPDEPFEKLKKEYDPERDRDFLRFLYIRSASPNLPRPSQEDEAQLQTKVSKEAQEVLAKADEHERSRIIQWWIGAAVLSRMRTNPSLEELQKFAQESLSDAERFRLGESAPRSHVPGAAVPVQPAPLRGDPSRRIPLGSVAVAIEGRVRRADQGSTAHVRRKVRDSASVGFSRSAAPRTGRSARVRPRHRTTPGRAAESPPGNPG